MSEETKKMFDEVIKDNESFKRDDSIWAWIVLLMIFVAFPVGGNEAMHYDKQTIAYQQGKIDAYEKLMEG